MIIASIDGQNYKFKTREEYIAKIHTLDFMVHHDISAKEVADETDIKEFFLSKSELPSQNLLDTKITIPSGKSFEDYLNEKIDAFKVANVDTDRVSKTLSFEDTTIQQKLDDIKNLQKAAVKELQEAKEKYADTIKKIEDARTRIALYKDYIEIIWNLNEDKKTGVTDKFRKKVKTEKSDEDLLKERIEKTVQNIAKALGVEPGEIDVKTTLRTDENLKTLSNIIKTFRDTYKG